MNKLLQVSNKVLDTIVNTPLIVILTCVLAAILVFIVVGSIKLYQAKKKKKNKE